MTIDLPAKTSEAALADELDAMTRLHALADRLLFINDLRAAMAEILDAAILLHGAAKGTIQIYDSEADCLRYAASRGFDEAMLATVPPIDRDFHSTCAVAIRTNNRVIASDLWNDPAWADHASISAQLGYQAAISSCMKTREDELLGVLTVHFPEPYTPTERELRWADLYARLAAHIVERGRGEAERRHAEASLRDSEQLLRAAVGERDALLKELHHRVKNNLQVITGLLEMQVRKAPESATAASLSDARDRITAIAAIHELLYQSGSFSRIDFPAYARRLVSHVGALYSHDGRVQASVTGDDIRIDLARAVPFGLMLNELISNAYKHAFPADATGELRIELEAPNGDIRLMVADSGVGLPAGFEQRQSGTLGLQLVRMLAKQLGGTVSITSADGTTVEVRVPSEANGA